ncbi:Flp family type IVb pilin [Tessaracoccus oleiagri]|uniref:Pilus assembly protein Flp/PilA n=1 Tax=Tessaracoccus oleiagri TaxID=686624 RepID=A0A1G9MHC3_9ACTN|nr:Flp family type IVb pilin [Tessaracoccus oleiagri]SDL73668.1 pilus assembly protein Flp/PilA [Tessaracoccus oleiagri]
MINYLFAMIDARFGGSRDRGATAVEYGLLVGLIAVVIIVAVTALGGTLQGLFTDVKDALPEPTSGASASTNAG